MRVFFFVIVKICLVYGYEGKRYGLIMTYAMTNVNR
jgi:hypothetical protein